MSVPDVALRPTSPHLPALEGSIHPCERGVVDVTHATYDIAVRLADQRPVSSLNNIGRHEIRHFQET